MKKQIQLLTLNIGNPSLKRVQSQIEWLENRPEDIFVLTETKVSEGCSYLEQYFSNNSISLFDDFTNPQFHVYFPKSSTGDLGVMILSKYPIIRHQTCFEKTSPFFSRLLDVTIDVNGTPLGVIGLYVPSRDASQEKINRKKKFAIEYLYHLKNISVKNSVPYIICGDLNILEKNHVPHYSNFQQWEYDFYDRFEHFGYKDAFRALYPDSKEYSWVGRTNDGYRYDHIFVSDSLVDHLDDCFYLSETRTIPITDHSAMVVRVTLP